MEINNENISYNINPEKKPSKQFKKNSIPKPLKKTKKFDPSSFTKRKLVLSRNDNLLQKFSNSHSNSKKDLIKISINTVNTYNKNKTSNFSEKIINDEIPKRKLCRAKTFLGKCDDDEWKNELISKYKRKKVKNLELLIKLVDESEKIENEYYNNVDDIENKKKNIKFERNKSDVNLYTPCVTYNKNDIFFNKKYDLIKNKFCFMNNNSNINTKSNKYIHINSLEKECSAILNENNGINHKVLSFKNLAQENIQYESSNLLLRVINNKINNIPSRKKKKQNSLYSNNLSPNNTNNNIEELNKKITSREISENNLLETHNSSCMNSFITESNINNNLSKTKLYNLQRNFSNYSNSHKILSNFSKSKSKSKEKKIKTNIFPLVNKIIKESSKIEEELKNNYKIDKNEEIEKDKKKKILEVKNLTKRRKINIDILRKKLNLDKNYFDENKRNNCFDINEILKRNTNNMKKIVNKNGIEIIREAANKILFEDKLLHKDIIYYNNRLLGQFKENKRDKMFNKIFEKQKQIKKEILGKPNTQLEKNIQQLEDDILE